jgi:3-phenylpropionate/trans-cinnamate dioxygenase ferredoxin subunit
MTRILACRVGDLAIGDARRLELSPPVTLFHAESGFFAIDDTCPHGRASLSEGYVEDDSVECPLHLARFCLRTGNVLCPPATQGVATHKVSIEGNDVFVEVARI